MPFGRFSFQRPLALAAPDEPRSGPAPANGNETPDVVDLPDGTRVHREKYEEILKVGLNATKFQDKNHQRATELKRQEQQLAQQQQLIAQRQRDLERQEALIDQKLQQAPTTPENPSPQDPAVQLDPYSDNFGNDLQRSIVAAVNQAVAKQLETKEEDPKETLTEDDARRVARSEASRVSSAQKNWDAAQAYCEQHGLDMEEFVETLRGLPPKARFGTEDTNGIFRYNDTALKAVHRIIDGDSLEEQARIEGRQEALRGRTAMEEATAPDGGGGIADPVLSNPNASAEEKAKALGEMGNPNVQFKVIDNLPEKDLISLVQTTQRQMETANALPDALGGGNGDTWQWED